MLRGDKEKVYPNAWTKEYELRDRLKEFQEASIGTSITGGIAWSWERTNQLLDHKLITDFLVSENRSQFYSFNTNRGRIIVVDFGVELTGNDLWRLMRSVGPADAGGIAGPLDDLRRLLHPQNRGDNHLVTRHGLNGIDNQLFQSHDFKAELFEAAMRDFMIDAPLYEEAMTNLSKVVVPIAMWETTPSHWWQKPIRKRTNALYSDSLARLREKILEAHQELAENTDRHHPRMLNLGLGNMVIAHFAQSVTKGLPKEVPIPGQSRKIDGARKNFHGGLQIDVTLRMLNNEKRVLYNTFVDTLEQYAPMPKLEHKNP